MTNFRNNRTLRKVDFECRAYAIDYENNQILADLHNPNVKPRALKRHVERISKLLEDYKELQLCCIDVIPIDVEYLESLCGLLFDKYHELLVVE